jgi:ABC-type transporter Mla subunit MlaD
MRRVLVGLAVLGVCAAAFMLAGASEQGSEGKSYKVVFDNAFGLTQGGDFRVGGVTAGKTTSFDVEKRPGESPKAVVNVEITKPGFDDFRTDATCDIRPQSLIGEYYVDCQPGKSEERLPEGGKVPVEQTTSTIPVDIVNNIMRRPYRERFRLIVTELGTGLAGRPDDLQEVLRRAHPGLRETSRVLRILGDQNRVIKNFITDSDTVVRELERNKRDVVRFVREAGDAAEISATRREELRANLQQFPEFLDELRPTMTRLGELADEQTPLLADLQRAAPDLDTFFTRVGPFADASRPAVRSLGEAGEVGTRAFRKGREEMAELRTLAAGAQPFAKPLRQFLQTSDDRRRAIEDDPRAKAAAPPAPDPTAISGNGGFTGFEAIWNFFFWQTLSINMLDDTGHMLRASLNAVPGCINWRNEPPKTPADEELFERCNSYLGPNQPGIFSPDPLDDGTNPSAARLRAESGRPATQLGEQRGEGQPEAGPLPGQPDLSKPQIVLPPQVQELLDSLTPKQRRKLRDLPPDELPKTPEELQQELQEIAPSAPVPAPAPETTAPLLDYLLAP